MKHSFSDPIAAHGWETGEALQFGGPDTSPDPLSSLRHIERMANWLSKAMALAAGSEPVASSAAEWLLDNGYQVQRAMLLVHKDMPEGFYARLRPVTAGPASCEPRVLMLAHDLLVASHFQLSRDNVMAYLQGYQSHSALDIAELWALPAMLRIACLERLVVGFEDIFPDLPPPFVPSKTCNSFLGTLESIDCVARSIANLGVISSIDWKDIFDQCSEVDKALSQDPARTYPNMDFETRDACRRVIEQVARHSGSDEVAIAGAALDLSRQHDELPMSHVGYWLIGEGFPRLEQSLGVTRSLRRRVVRWLRRHHGGVYAAALFLCGIVGMAIPLAYLWMQGATVWQWVLALVVTALPATVLSVTIVNWLVTQAVSPKRLAKLDFSEGIAPDWPTLVIVPVIVAGRADIDAALQRLSAHQLANPEAAAFVLLSDPVDAHEQRSADDDLVEARLREGIETLNKQRGPCFCLMHRARMFNPAQGCWMAWERKRGKIEQFNEFLLTGNAEAFPVTAGPTGDLVGSKFVVTADADTRLPPGCVARLAGTLAHPLNRPRIDRDGRITAGYSVMQPRIEIAPHGANSLFARLFGGDTAIDIYSRAVSDVYQDLTGTGNFVGKGIYDVAAFHRSLAGRVQLVSRTTRGAALTEAGTVFRDHAAKVSAEVDLAREAILPNGDLCGLLRVAAPLSFGPTHFAPVLARMALLHPRLHIHTCYTDRFVDLIAEGFDCGIRVGTLEDSNLVAKLIGPIYGKCVASPAYLDKHGSPETPEELLSHEALMQGTETWQFTDGDKIVTIHPQGRFKADNGIALVDAAIAGLGIARVPDGLTADHIIAGALVPVMPRFPPPPAGAYVVRPPGRYTARKIRVLTEMLISCFQDMPARKES